MGDIEEQLQPIFRFFALVDISQQDVPAGDATLRVSHGESANLEPAVYPIGTSAAVLDVVGRPGFDGIPKGSDHAREIVGMDGVDGSPTLTLHSCIAKIFRNLAVAKFDPACPNTRK